MTLLLPPEIPYTVNPVTLGGPGASVDTAAALESPERAARGPGVPWWLLLLLLWFFLLARKRKKQ